MANPNDNLRRLYQNGLKHFSLPDFDTFQQDMRDEEKRKRFYNNMQGAYSLPDFDTFSQDIGAVTPPPAQPQAQAQPQQTTSTVKPVTDNTAQQASVQPTVQTSSQPAQPEGWKPTPMQQRAFQMQMDEANARLKKQGEEFKQRMEGIEKGNRPGAFMGEREFNPQTGKMETHYYTTQGERVGTRMEQSHANTEYHNWWENNTEAGKRSKEQRLQREFDEKLSYLWQRHNPAEGENAAEQAWSAAESAYNAKAERNREAANFNVQNFAMNSTDAVAFKQVETVDNFTDRLTTHDMNVLMDNAWNNLGEEGQKSLIDDCYQMLRRRNPGVDDLVLYGKAKEFARQQSDLRMYHLAVEKNLPKSNLEYFMRKVGDMNLVTNIAKGIAVNRVKKTGDMAAYEAANEQYRQDGHKILDVAGTVTGFALDPTTWMSAGVGGMATRGAMWAGGRVLAGRGATAAVTNAATRQFATSMTGRVIGGIAGGAANFGTFEGIKEMETQFAHGGHIVGQDDTGRYLNEGYSASAVAGQAAHGFLMGGAIGWLTPVSGNVADKLVRSTSSTGLKVMERAGVYSGATMLEGTIFSVPEWIEGNRDAMDVWTDNMAMMVGFKAKHMIKSAGNVLGDLKASFDSPTNGRKNRLDFESRLRQRMDAPSDGGLSLTKDEAAELSKHGYGDLRELVESAERTGDATKGELITANAPEIVSRLTDMVTDPRISEAARAKMYYYATGRKLPESTVMKGELIEDGEGGFIVESQGANGVITSRSFKSRKAADLELERIKRQTELNHIEIGERYQQTADFENRLQEACRTVAAENGWDMVEVYRTCEEARRNNLRGGDKQFDEAQQNILRKVTEAMGEFEETSVTDNMRGRINDKYGVDIDNAIRKEANRRTIAEQTAIDEYLDELIPKNAKERNTVEDAEAEAITNQKLLTDEPEATTPTNDAPIDPRFDNPTTPEYDPHQPGGEQKPVGRAVMKYQDRPVEVLSGRVVMMEDGTMIDNERSDASIVVRDLETGKVEMVSPDAILSYEGYPAEVEVPQDNVAPEAETPAEPQPKYTTGQIKIRNSDGTETRGVLTGFVDENGNHEYYVEGDLQQLHYASEHELDNILSEYTPDEPQEVKQPQPAEPQPVDPNRPTQEGVANVEDYDKGYSFGIDETQGISDSELTAKISELRTDAERLTDFGRGMLEAYEYEQQRRAMEQQLVPVDAETVPKTEETTLNPMETGVNITETVPKTEETTLNPMETGVNITETVPKTEIPIENVQQSVDDGNVVVPAPATNEAPQVDNVSQPDLTAQAEPTPLQRIPRNEKNEPIFEQAESPEVGWDALVEFSEGDAATAKEIADTMVEEKRKAFEKAQKLKPKGKTPTEILASKKANTAELTKAQAEYEQWQRMAGVENARQSAIRSQQEVEARRLAAERAEAEKAEREAREEAARLEREALEGIPEWHMDTPENARKRGVRRFSGQMFTRQEPVQGVVGNEVEVKFSQKDLPKGRVAVIEASQLQPSHVQGQRNPMFFIEEAQPKNRTEAVSMFAAKEMAEGIRPKEITGSVTAYTGAPTVNTRGEVIQGNNRSDALRYLWQSNLPQQQQTYKQYLIDNAEQFGIDPEAVNAMQNPVLVNMLDVDDAEAIRLGQMTAQDTESGGIERIKPKNVAQTLGDNMRTFANMLLSSGEEDVSFGQLVDRNGTEVMKWMNQVGAISNTQFQSAFDSKSNLTAEAKNDLQKVLYQAVFKGASQQLEEMFDKLPAKAQRAILATAFRDMDSPFAGKMLPEIQASIIVYNQLMSDPTFANAKKMEEVLKAVEAFKQTIALDDRFEHYMPADNFSNFALHLAAMYKATDMSQATIASYFNQMYDLAQGKKAATLFDEADTTEYPLAEVINQVLNFEYQPAKNGNNDVANGGADVALRNQVSQGGELRGNEPPASGEQTPTGTEPSDSGAGASDDSSTAGVEAVEGETPQSTDAAPATVQAAVEAASAEVNTEPTPAQAEAGNYKKDHITIGEFDITIENPAGSVRKGIDADGKEWSTTMANTYGYIKGTEGVDGDHIDVFLHENMDMWNGRKVYVVDQTNTDGSFDEHKVMLGFNNKDEAMSAYLANYDATWGQTHPGLRISETNIEDFNKWVQSSHRKTKPFADYSTVSKITDEAPVEQPTQPAAAITGEGYKVEPKPYTNKQGKTLDTYLVTFDRDFSKEELSTLRAKAKALKGWYDRETRGWMLRSADDAKAFAKDIVGKSEDFRGRIEAAERSIERNNAELQSISARDGVPFKFTEELAKAEEKLSEYEDLMKAEMEAKEAKYAELDKEVEAASNIELTEEDSEDAASEPIASYSEENANFASRYETQDGKTINYTSENAEGYGGLFDFDFSGENAGGNEVGMRSGANDLQRQGDTGLNRHNSRLDKEAGEFSLIERVFRESGSFNFTSGEKIESADDVAFIFSALEDAAKEHSFVVLVKDGKPTVVELGMGTFTATMVDIPTASLAYNRIQPDQVYFVHNHPSGNLMCSPQDVQMLRKIADISKVPVHGVIINLKTGKYGTFDTDNTSGVGQKRVPENESPLAVHTLDKQIFAPNYDPMEQPLVRGSEDVAKFLNSQRMGDRAKMSFIILSRAGRIVGNIHTPFTKLPTKSDEIARYISERVIQFGGESAILYGDFTHEGSKMVAYRNLKDNLNKVGGTTLLDVVNVEGNNTRSANDDGLLYELGSEYGASTEAKSSHAERMSKKFNTPIRIVTDTKELTNDNSERQARMRRSKGFYDPATGEVVIVLPNNANVEDVAETVFHEVVAHRGLREMIGEENYDAFCDEVYNHLKDDLKKEVDEETTRRFVNEPGKGYEHHRRVAVDEMFGRMAEKGFEDFTKAERGIWAKLKAKVLEAINKFLGSLKLPKWVKLGDNELRYMLWRSHERLRSKGDYVDMARDAAKREELGLSAEARFRDGETGDIWKDQSVGLQERITNAAIRLSNNQSADLTLRNDAMRAVTNNLQSLLHSMRNRRGTAQSFVGADRKVEAGVVDAMNAQAMFDRSTVKRVSDLARILMQNGYLSGMTSGEMQRLLSAVKNATAMHDIADSVQKIMDIMVDNQLRNGEASLRQLLAIRGSKVDARGVEVQGALDVDGQHTMEVVKKAISLTEDDITDRIAEALNRMSDPDQTIADQAAIEYAGLNMALDYVQNIANSKAEEKALRDSLKIAKEDRDAGRMTDDAYKQFIETTEDAIRKNKIERTEAYFNLVGRLSDSLRGSIENAKAFREAEKARISEIHHNANSDMEGRPTNEHHKDDWQDKFVNNGFVQFLFAPLGTFDQIMRVFGNKSANGEGYLWNRFMRGWVDCRNKELRGIKDKFAQLDEKAAELFGKSKTWGDIIRMERKLPKASVSFWDGGEMRDHELTQGNLLYIYMVDKMTDGRMKLRRMGITEQNVADIENFLDPRFKALGDWLQDDFLVATRNEYNETHKRMFGASMAAIENYFPLKILANARVDKEEDVNQQNRPDGITTKTGSIIKRRVNNLALDITGADALSVILDHITQMEHWSAYAEWNRDLNTLRTYKRFRNQVINMTTVYGGGRRLWENFNDLCLMAAGEYRPPVSRLNKNAVNLAKGVTAAKVSFRLFTALKQFLSAPAYAPEVNLKSIAKSIANPYGDFKWCLENLPIFRERWHSRISGDPRLLKSDMDWKMWRSRVMEISSRIGMTPNAFVDAVAVSIGARAMYETRLNQYLKEGYPADAAEKRAMQDATILFNQTQQSSESPFLSTMQVDKDWLSTLFTVFRNSSMSYTRQEFDAMRNLKRNLTPGQRAKSIEFMTKQILRDWDIDPDSATDDESRKAREAAKKRFGRQIKKDVMRIATFGFILQALWNLGPYLPYIFFGNEDDEKDKMWDDALTHAYFGSVEGLTGGDVMSSFGNMWASGEWSRNQLSKDMPLASDINTIANKFIGGKNAEAVNDILNLLVQSGIGMNPQSLTDAAIAITDACGDDPALSHEAAIFVMRVLQVPQSQLDKLYFDEIGLNGEEASKLTPQQLAARYAEYKVKRGTPLAPWFWGDEERLGKYEELAKDRMTERLESRGDAAVKEAYADFEARYKAVNEKAEKARAMIKTDYAAAAQAHAALQQDPDFTLYQRFGSLDKQLGRISKMWLTSKTPEEAALIASTIPAYRAGMVKVLQAETVENQQSAMSELTTLMNEFYSKYQAMQPQSQQLNR
ncbi:JAB domain-containing protein [Duncaniella muris]|uniref:JAB domain-containing protein n=1 Tax=Duncaniella muris TaxID=2094150 RepID=UPI0026E040D3|nr:JAB domain-containing protein [Duncaniella muris]